MSNKLKAMLLFLLSPQNSFVSASLPERHTTWHKLIHQYKEKNNDALVQFVGGESLYFVGTDYYHHHHREHLLVDYYQHVDSLFKGFFLGADWMLIRNTWAERNKTDDSTFEWNRHHETNFSTFAIKVGYAACRKGMYCGSAIIVDIPLKNYHFWGVGGIFDISFQLWKSTHKSLDFFTEGKYLYAFKKRRVGIFESENRDILVSGFYFNGLLGFAFNWSDFTFDLGYNIYVDENGYVLLAQNSYWQYYHYDKTIDHQLYAGVGYIFNKNKKYPIMIGLGGGWVFPSDSDRCSAGTIWLKTGMSF